MAPAGARRSFTNRLIRDYATFGRVLVADAGVTVASFHALARSATSEELDGLDPDEVRRPDVPEPWLNDVAFARLEPALAGKQFIVGCDINTSRLFEAHSFFERAAAAGWVDLTVAVEGASLPTFLSHNSSRHQLDYLFVGERTAASCVSVDVDGSKTDREGDGTSDHAPLIARFEF